MAKTPSCSHLQLEQEYCCQAPLDLYKTPHCDGLVTQAQVGRHLQIIETVDQAARSPLRVRLCDDDYPGWISADCARVLTPAAEPYQPDILEPDAISANIYRVVDFAQAAMQHTNCYLWGGTIGPNFDCSGLVQAAFASIGVVLPRDSYQQEQFVSSVVLENVVAGDLLFFGTPVKTTHVALYIGNGEYIHSSGRKQGRNGIGVDSITRLTDPISQAYYQQLLGAGRVTRSYQTTGQPMNCR